MATPILATKLYIPPPRPKVVARPRLLKRLNEGLAAGRAPGVTLISAPAGFGKTTLLSEWINQKDRDRPTVGPASKALKAEGEASLQPLAPGLPEPKVPCGRGSGVSRLPPASQSRRPPVGGGQASKVAWLSLDEADNDPARFLAHLVAALQTIAGHIGAGVMGALQTPQPPPAEAILTTLLNDISTLPNAFILVLDDFHVIEAQPVDRALAFMLEHLPPQMHLVIATREDPDLPLARLRARGQLTELRAADLRFTAAEAAEFLNRVMGLRLAAADIATLEQRTEGWIAGLQLAALSMQAHPDAARFIQAFTGGHHFVLDYLVEEVLQQQPESVQRFLLRTSVLDRLCGPLCEAVLQDDMGRPPTPAGTGQAMLEQIERANLFIIPLDNERRWYRYHHLFADLLRQRLQQPSASGSEAERGLAATLHIRASQWYEDNGLDIEAFRHAAAANDIERAERLIEGKAIPLHLRGAVTMILDWLAALPEAVLNARPSLWWRYGSLLLVNGQTIGVAEKLQAAEDALPADVAGFEARHLVGRIAAARAVLALTRYQVDAMLAESRRALEYLHPDNRGLRANAYWTLGFAHFLQGDRAAARQAYTEAIALSQAIGDIFTTILATIGLGGVQEADNELYLAAETYQRSVHLAGEQPQQIISEPHLGLARVRYEWNDLEAAEHHGRQSLQLARQYESVIDRFIICELFLARLKLAQGQVAEAGALLAQAEQAARQKNFVHRLPEVAAGQAQLCLRQGNLAAAAELAGASRLPISQARVLLAQGDAPAALAVLDPWRQQVKARGWQNERLTVLLLEAVAFHILDEKEQALQRLDEALALAEPGGFVRSFIDEGPAMAQLLAAAAAQGLKPDYVGKLLAAFDAEQQRASQAAPLPSKVAQPLDEPLSQRELEVLQLMAQGLSNQAIAERLYLALDTVKGHNRRIFDKLQVQRRTEAVARARALRLL